MWELITLLSVAKGIGLVAPLLLKIDNLRAVEFQTLCRVLFLQRLGLFFSCTERHLKHILL